ncbi:hypothetical protein [Tamlana sp. I1]|uniref:hypothetical protein n=1 Tax=Tamlana sp. I1 TaxID=2762061 RepID=UPI00188E9E4C|nr:hypothetical protein [Tamlana sp. I1]
MKKTVLSIVTFVALFIVSCEGPQGPPGADGISIDIVGQTYEITNVNFSATQDLERFFFPNNLVDGDAVLVYRLEGVDNGLDIWEPLPTATIFFDDGGFFQYRFNYTIGDVDIIAESDDLNAIGADLMLNQTFRIVVMPSDMAATINTNKLEDVMKYLNIKEMDIQNIK